MRTLQELQTEVTKWTRATFPGETIEGKVNKLREELEELAIRPGDLSEQADVLILLVGLARMTGSSGDELLAAAFAKMEINRRRKWAPEPAADGTWKHQEVNP